jgi:TolB protein
MIDLQPAWSPDGTQVAFYHNGVVSIDYETKRYEVDPDSQGVWLMRPDGTNKRPLLISASLPAWSSDSQWLAVVYGGAHIWKVRANGDSLTQLTYEGKSFFPAWAPIGDDIAFDSNVESGGSYSIWLMKADGSDKRRVVPGRIPNWDPVGDAILHLGRVQEKGSGIVRFDLLDSTSLLLFNAGDAAAVYTIDSIRCSPDGQSIAFNWKGHLWIMDADGSNARQITFESGEKHPSWSPDGARMIYAADAGLWIINADGSGAHQITFPPN